MNPRCLVTQRDCDAVATKLNSRLHKRLGLQTPGGVLCGSQVECDERVIPNTPEAVRRLLSRHPAGDRSDSSHSVVGTEAT